MKILAIGAHLDDIELACGGVLAKAVKAGHIVKMVVMTDSAYSNFNGTVFRTKEEALQEGQAAMERLGVTDLVILDFPNKNIPYNGSTVEALDKIMTDFRPDYIFTHWVFDTHQDHKNTAQATISAARYMYNIFMYEPIPPSGRSYAPFRAQAYFDISDSIEDKLASLKEHKSQHAKYGEQWIEAIEGRAKLRGFENGCKYAEAFETVRLSINL
jgi:LmbE family N-acetylglucosaminyl deacetylase